MTKTILHTIANKLPYKFELPKLIACGKSIKSSWT